MPGFERQVFSLMAEMGWLSCGCLRQTADLALEYASTVPFTRELGIGLVPEPLIGAVLACRLMQAALPVGVLDGSQICLAAWQDEPNSLEWSYGVSLHEGRLEGTKRFVPAARGADLFAVPFAEGVALVTADAAGLTVSTDWMWDGCLLGTLDFDSVMPNAVPPLPPVSIEDALDEASLATAAYLLGVADTAFELTVEYLKMRQQFGRLIGSFQALQHRATDMKIQLELARASMDAAACAIDLVSPERAAAVCRAKCRAGEVAMLVAREAVQMHGAIGFTEECDVGLFVRKAMASTPTALIRVGGQCVENVYVGPAPHRMYRQQ